MLHPRFEPAFVDATSPKPPPSRPQSAKCAVSVLILTLNEERNIAECLASLAWCDDVVVLDSFSSDKTREIAASLGARVVRRQFDDWSSHQNWAVQNIDFEHEWVLYLDADERCDPALAKEVVALIGSRPNSSAFRVRRKDYFMGTWLKHAQLYPTWLVRLFRPGHIRYERLVNPVAVVNGETGTLNGHITHFPFSHGISHWVARHNRYSDLEANEAIKENREELHGSQIFSADPNLRRRALKRLFFRLPARPLIKFCYYYVYRRGFLDGRPGFTYAALQSFYEFLIECKTQELRRREAGLR